MALPLLSALKIDDIVAVRELPAWHEFARAQQDILLRPLEILDRLQAFTGAFNAFQSELSDWYFKKYKMAERVERYANFATVALQVAGSTLVGLGFPGHDALSLLDRSIISNAIPLVCKRPTVKLMVSVIDLLHKRIDPSRSYSIDLMQVQANYTRDQVRDLVQKFCGGTDESDVYEDHYAALLSDQGK
ncbi:hypothetical protein DMT42_17010 [Streptomyces actuosus]|uniref:Uncharacterized protein n=2 Tax=Streptomyces TaxID=1883 RepID=A0A2U9P2L7_STRAS|nr:hypothetical protein DMT42_17010 [Streptomyces actuosus]